MCSNKTQTDTTRLRVEREIKEYHDDAAAMDWIKREHNVYETEDLYLEEHLEIAPTVLQPGHHVTIVPKMEPTSLKRESPIPGCSSAATTVSHVGVKNGKQSLTSTQPVQPALVHIGNIFCPSKPNTRDSTLLIHTGERPFCFTICDAKFFQSHQLEAHNMRKHTSERPFSCSICEAKFGRSSCLKIHMRVHTGERPFSCTICEAKFGRSSYLKIHMRVHTGERPFRCSICNSKFVTSSTLKAHMRIHTGVRPFGCSICNSKFVTSGTLKTHMRIHTGERPFGCSICNSKFVTSSTLKAHMRIHTGERPFACTICGATFSQPRYLKIHISRICTRQKTAISSP